jgi:hypothetical protein
MNRIHEVAAGAGVAAALVVVFVLCAVVELLAPSIQASHMWIDLFTTYPVSSLAAWVSGILSNAVGGFVAGYVFAWKYNKVVRHLNK